MQNNYGIQKGDRVCHTREQSWIGTVIHIDTNLEDVTTCNIIWDDQPAGVDIQWTNKLLVINQLL